MAASAGFPVQSSRRPSSSRAGKYVGSIWTAAAKHLVRLLHLLRLPVCPSEPDEERRVHVPELAHAVELVDRAEKLEPVQKRAAVQQVELRVVRREADRLFHDLVAFRFVALFPEEVREVHPGFEILRPDFDDLLEQRNGFVVVEPRRTVREEHQDLPVAGPRGEGFAKLPARLDEPSRRLQRRSIPDAVGDFPGRELRGGGGLGNGFVSRFSGERQHDREVRVRARGFRRPPDGRAKRTLGPRPVLLSESGFPLLEKRRGSRLDGRPRRGGVDVSR